MIDATDGGADVVVDHMPERYLQFDCDVADSYARIVLYRNRHREAQFTDLPSAGGKELEFHLMSAYNTPKFADPLMRIGRLLDDNWLTVEIDSTYNLHEADAAHRRVRNDSFFGKIVIIP